METGEKQKHMQKTPYATYFPPYANLHCVTAGGGEGRGGSQRRWNPGPMRFLTLRIDVCKSPVSQSLHFLRTRSMLLVDLIKLAVQSCTRGDVSFTGDRIVVIS
jgi:hypothetical protein